MDYSHCFQIISTIQAPDYPGAILDYSEAEFLLAEAAERSMYGTPADAEGHYNAGVTASILDWGGTLAEASLYLSQNDIAYSTAAGTWKQKIGEQAWIALYNRGFEGWSSYRRLDFPVLAAPAEADITQVPTRYTYPSREETLNGTNVEAAGTAIGGNTLTTKVFWDVFNQKFFQ